MTLREMNLAVFRGKPLPHVFFQPRFEPWYHWHRQFGKMPPAYREMSLPALYDYCHASMRTVDYYTSQPHAILREYDPQVKIRSQETADRLIQVFETPHGELVEEHERTVDQTWREVRFPVRDRDDLLKLRWLYQHTRWSFSAANFEVGNAFIGDRGEGSFWVPKSPYQALAQQWMKLEDLVYALADCPDVVEDTMRAIDDSYDPLYAQLTAYPNLHILNFGENIHEQLFSPAYWDKYLVPFFHKRCAQLHLAGKFTHIHIDGHFRHMLPRLPDLPHHGIEALTPVPQGDMTLEEIRPHLGDTILLDGIPAVLFLPDLYSREQLMECVQKVVNLFHPRLVLGVSDEVPEGAPEEAIERVRLIGQWCAG